MSFCVDLWNGLNTIKSHFTLTFNKISSISNILFFYTSYLKTYYKNLDGLYNQYKDLIKDDYSLDKSISMFIEDIKKESDIQREHYKFIKHNVLVSLKDMYDKEKSSSSNDFNEGQQNIDNFQKIKNNLINKQKNYNNSLKDFFSFMSTFNEKELNIILEKENKFHSSISSDISNINVDLATFNNTENKINEIINDTEPNSNQNNINNLINIDKQLITKKQKLFDKIYESKKEYISAIEEANNFLNIYKTKAEKVFNLLETNYISIIRGIHWTLSTFVNHKLILYDKLNSLYKNYSDNSISKVNDENEVYEFIIRNATKEFPINKIEFVPYKLENKSPLFLKINQFLNKRLELEKAKDSTRNKSRKKTEIYKHRRRAVKKKNTNEHNDDNNISVLEDNIKSYKIKSNMYLIEDFIEEIITDKDDKNEMEGIGINENYFDDNDTIMKDLNQIKLLLLDDKNNDNLLYLDCLIKTIDKYRAKGNFLLIKKSYDILIEIFNFLLNHFSSYDHVLKNILILAQTFYYIDNENKNISSENKKEKIFIQNGLKNHLILNKSETWHRVINYALSENILNKDNSIITDKNEINNKLNIISHNTIVAYLCDLKYFSEDEQLFNKVRDFYIRVYHLDLEKVNNEVNSIFNNSKK